MNCVDIIDMRNTKVGIDQWAVFVVRTFMATEQMKGAEVNNNYNRTTYRLLSDE